LEKLNIRFDNKTVVVMGGSSGIGKATVKLFAQSGGKVIFTGIEDEKQIDVKEFCSDGGLVPVYQRLDVSVEEDVKKLTERVEIEFGGCDVLFNNVGILTENILHEIPTEVWHRNIDVNVNGMYYASKYFLPQMIKKGGGAVVNTSSVSGLFGDYTLCVYNTTKGAVANLTRNMALDYAQYNIRVNAVAPGITKTPMYYGFAKAVGGQEVLDYGAAVVYPGRRVGLPEEIANAVVFLASDRASFISGVNLMVDGGITAHTGQQRDYDRIKEMLETDK
jgi:NAD(P)-dependent dehydrogenase (short-subunit alcohol dehydrogenase family)